MASFLSLAGSVPSDAALLAWLQRRLHGGPGASIIHFRLLGPLEAEANGDVLSLGSTKQRALLAVLLLHANEFVSHDRLIDALWGENAPAGAGHSLQVYISGLRKALAANGGRELLVTRSGGYLIKLEREQLDLARFRALVEEGRNALAVGASTLGAEKLRDALSLWRGDPLADLGFEPFAQAAIERLEELRTAALEDRIEADLGAGRASELLPELESLIGRHPFRERLRRQLMLALYRAGRQAEALQVYRETRRLLSEELGIEPGPELQQLEQAILCQDAALDLPASPEAATVPESPSPRLPAARGSTRRLLLMLAPVLVGAGLALFFLLRGGSSGLARIDPNAVGVIDPKSGSIVAEVRGAMPTAAAFGAHSLWVTSAEGGSVLRIDPKTSEPLDTIDVGYGPSGIAFGDGAVWVANSGDGTVSRIDPGVDRVVQTIPVGSSPSAIAVGTGSVWVANTDDRTVMRLDARSGRVAGSSYVGFGPRSIAVGGGGVWVTDGAGASVVRLDAKTGAITDTVGVGNEPEGITFGAGSLWVANSADGTVSRIDPDTKRVRSTITVGDGSTGLAFAAGRLWVSNELAGTIVRVDPHGNRALRSWQVAERPTAVVAASRRLWILAGPSARAHRGGTLAVSTAQLFNSVDPALAYTSFSWAALIMTNDGLTGFERVAGADGGRLVPDLAVSLPAPTEGGRAYRFQVRRGLRYSTGALVRPEDFRRALERDFALHSPGSSYYRSIVGAKTCIARPARCDLSQGIVADDAANAVVFHLVAPDAEFLYKLALPFADAVPAGTPLRAAAQPLPATGPYAITAYAAGSRLRLERNPHFREWSRAAQPDGYPAEIVVKLGHASHTDLTRVLRGTTDLLYGKVPLDRLGELATRYAGQLHLNPIRATVFLFLNTRVSPFDDVRVRRAINYALDREAFAKLTGATLLVQPTCQILPPHFPGYASYCPYTSKPGPRGRWSGPDLARARRLIAASGTEGERITVSFDSSFPRPPARYVASLLRRLGYRASLEILPEGAYFARVRDSSRKLQIGNAAWVADLPVASNFIVPTLSCASFRASSPSNTNVAEFCDPAIDAEIQKATDVQTLNPSAADRLWTRIEHQLVDQAPWVPLLTYLNIDFVSKRVGNYEYNPQWGVLIDQLWVR